MSDAALLESGVFPLLEAHAPSGVWSTIDGGNPSLDVISVPRRTQGLLRLSIGESGRIRLALQAEGGYVQVGVRSGSHVAAGTSALSYKQSIETDTPVPMLFRTRQGDAPASFEFSTDAIVTLHNLPITDLRFGREMHGMLGNRQFESTIHSATITFADTEQRVELSEGQSLDLDGITDGRVVTVAAGRSLELAFEGKARVVRAGYSTLRRISPSWLEWIYYHARTHLLVIVVPGLVWTMLSTRSAIRAVLARRKPALTKEW